MPHQCTKCGEVFPDAAPELLAGCTCGSKFFYYIRQERFDELNRINNQEIQETIEELNKADKTQIEKDIREITGLDEEPDKPVILNIESVRVIKPGKFEIDIINLFSKKRPLIYRLEEGKYIIDLTSSLNVDKSEVDKKIRNPDLVKEKTSEEDEIEEENEEDEEDSEEESEED
ncbi:Zn-ribbon containing protein [uncultured archaeon]|nr:Zn-ribbon containing protein [uncultured archaeon]